MRRACLLTIAAVLVAECAQASPGGEPQEVVHRRVDTSGPVPGVPRSIGLTLPTGTDVTVGLWPSQLVIAGHDAWILNKGSQSISIVDLDTRSVVASFENLRAPDTISISADGSTVFVVHALRYVDPAAGRVLTTYPMGVTQLEDLVVSRDGKKLFAVAGPVLNAILVVDTATGALRRIPLDPSGLSIFFGGRMAIDPSGDFLFVNVLDRHSPAAAVVSTTEERVLSVIPRGFWGLTFSKDGRRAYLLDPEWDWRRGLVVSLPSLEIASHLPVGGAGAVLSADGATMFFTRFGAAFRRSIFMYSGYEERYDVGTLHLASGRAHDVDVSPELVSCTFERGLGLTADGRYLVVSNPALDNVTIFDLARSPLR